jgi:hypothetical protein
MVEAPVGGRSIARLRADIDPAGLGFELMSYADDAQHSYRLFTQAREQGRLASDAKFLFAMPTPISPMAFVAEESRDATLPAYEAEQHRHVERVLASIPHDDLCIQWDMVQEVMAFEGRATSYTSKDAVTTTLTRLASWIPDDVEMGLHLCEGDRNLTVIPGVRGPAPRGPGRTLEGPDDATHVVECANALCSAIQRRVDFIHLPSWVNWTVPESFAPLSRLSLDEATQLYLGIVHPQDGTAGGRMRRAYAAQFLRRPFGISKPCGMVRYGDQAKFQSCATALKTLPTETKLAG